MLTTPTYLKPPLPVIRLSGGRDRDRNLACDPYVCPTYDRGRNGLDRRPSNLRRIAAHRNGALPSVRLHTPVASNIHRAICNGCRWDTSSLSPKNTRRPDFAAVPG